MEKKEIKLLTPKEVAEMLRVSVKTVYSWVNSGRIPYYKLAGSVVRFKEDEILKWIEESRGDVKVKANISKNINKIFEEIKYHGKLR